MNQEIYILCDTTGDGIKETEIEFCIHQRDAPPEVLVQEEVMRTLRHCQSAGVPLSYIQELGGGMYAAGYRVGERLEHTRVIIPGATP